MVQTHPAPKTGNIAADPDLYLDKSKRVCLACSMELPKKFVSAYGLKKRCPYCQHPYPLGHCSD